MSRTLCVILAVLPGCFGCGNGDSGTGPKPVVPKTTSPDPVEAEVPSPPTGIVKIEEMRKLARDDLERHEGEIGESAPDDAQRRSLGFVQGALEKARTAAQLGSRNEARQLVQERYGRVRKQHADMEAVRSEVWSEIRELQRIVDQIEEGTGTPPTGFTEAEIRDKLADARGKAEGFETRDEELRAEMKVCEDLLAQDVIEPTERTRFTDELEAIGALQERVEALLAR